MSAKAGATLETPQQAIAAATGPKLADLLTKETLLAALRRPATINPVELPEIQSRVYVRSLTKSQREEYLKTIRVVQPDGTVKVETDGSEERLAVMTVCDKAGNPIMTPEDVKAFREADWALFDRIVNAAGDINGFGDAAVQKAKNESAGQPAPADVSNTVSPAT